MRHSDLLWSAARGKGVHELLESGKIIGLKTKKENFVKILDEDAVRDLLQMEDLIPAIASALADLSSKKAIQPVRMVLPVADHNGFFGVMPAYNGALGAKVVTFYPENKNIHTHHAVILLFRPETGEPMAMIDGRLITEMRTAAASAVATDLLARHDSSVLAILGSGVQARSHLEALRRAVYRAHPGFHLHVADARLLRSRPRGLRARAFTLRRDSWTT